jgi:hypothetical protein
MEQLLQSPLAQKKVNAVFFSLMHHPCTLWFVTMPALASTKPQEGMHRGSELPRLYTWQPLVPSGMDASKRIPYKLQIVLPHVSNLPGKIGVSQVTC